MLAFGTIPFAVALEHFDALGSLGAMITERPVCMAGAFEKQNTVMPCGKCFEKAAVSPAAEIRNNKLKKSQGGTCGKPVAESVAVSASPSVEKIKHEHKSPQLAYIAGFITGLFVICVLYVFFKDSSVRPKINKLKQEPEIMEPIIVKGAESSKQMALAFFAVEEFEKWDFKGFYDESGVTPAMKISANEKIWYRGKKLIHDIMVSKWPNGYHVCFVPSNKTPGIAG
jgi:hypothetical protein